MSLNVPKVMVSSTFYDLRQIRTDLANFITDDLCYIPLLSELSSFPVDPDANTVENCCRRVEQDADILILIIGGRYGSIDTNSSRSITNLEYLTARTKGIPIYVFVEKAVLALLPIWERNKNADFSASIDDVRLLEFIYQIRSVDKAWVHEFENAQQIVATLRTQFAYRMREGLQLVGRLKDEGFSKIIYALGGKAIRIALEKPNAWVSFPLFSVFQGAAIMLPSSAQAECRSSPAGTAPATCSGAWSGGDSGCRTPRCTRTDQRSQRPASGNAYRAPVRS